MVTVCIIIMILVIIIIITKILIMIRPLTTFFGKCAAILDDNNNSDNNNNTVHQYLALMGILAFQSVKLPDKKTSLPPFSHLNTVGTVFMSSSSEV